MIIPLNDLKRQNKPFIREIQKAVKDVMARGWFILGPEVKSFEQEFADYCGAKYCAGLANGTDALELALRALKIDRDDEVVTVANAGMYSTIAIRAIGARPRYVDVDLSKMLMSVDSLDSIISEKTRAVIVTHLYGQIADMPKILKITNRYSIPVIEDCAQAHGAQIEQRKTGNWGILGCFSFYPTKNLGAFGDGGAITTDDSELIGRIRKLCQYGWGRKYYSEINGGTNSRLDEIQAAILRIKLKYLDDGNEQRRKISNDYSKYLCHLDNVKLPLKAKKNNVVHLYVIRSDLRDKIKNHLAKNNIATAVHYPIPDYHQLQEKHGHKKSFENFPNTEVVVSQILSLPCFPGMRRDEIEYVADSIITVAAENC